MLAALGTILVVAAGLTFAALIAVGALASFAGILLRQSGPGPAILKYGLIMLCSGFAGAVLLAAV